MVKLFYEQFTSNLNIECWAYAPRKFTEALKEDKTGAEYALEQIGLIYGVETMADDQNMNYGREMNCATDSLIQSCVLLKNGLWDTCQRHCPKEESADIFYVLAEKYSATTIEKRCTTPDAYRLSTH